VPVEIEGAIPSMLDPLLEISILPLMTSDSYIMVFTAFVPSSAYRFITRTRPLNAIDAVERYISSL